MWQKYHLLQPLRYEPHNDRLGAQGQAFFEDRKDVHPVQRVLFPAVRLTDGDHCISNPPVPSFKFLDGVDVAFVGLGRNPSDRCNLSDRHVLDHAPAQRAHCLVGYRDAPVSSEVADPSSQDRTPPCATMLAVPPAAATYRASGLVP